MTRRYRSDPAFWAGLVVVWAFAWSGPAGQLTWDTKYDLLIDPWGFLSRALNLWDPQVTWGGVANQGYGYLFPMGPFMAVASEVVPAWVAQRLWWSLILSLGFVGALGLLKAMDVGTGRGRVVGALSWVLAPKVVSSVSTLSAEIQPQILAPLVLWPVVLAWTGRLPAWRAAALSGVAILLCGGVNGTATLLALAPTGIFLVTRHRWWRSRLTWLWAGAALAATAWWLGPLLLMSRYVPPFLDWIETARAVAAPIGLLDVVRGTTHWLGHLLTAGGPWWVAGYQLATAPWLILLTAAVATLGLMGLALRSMPYRGFSWLALTIGVVALSLPHSGPLNSPAVDAAQAALDGALAPLRNIHKVDALVRLPLMLGMTHLLAVLCDRPTRQPHAGSGAESGDSATIVVGTARMAEVARRAAVPMAALLVVAAAAPAFTGGAVSRGGHEAVPSHWVAAGEWLDREAGTDITLVVPASSFGEYTWGRTIDEPLRALTSAPVAVRDAVPLAPAGAVRLLDEVERRLQTGRSIAGASDVLRQAGVGFLLVRNDLDTTASGQPSTVLARSAVRATEGVEFVRGFGDPIDTVTAERVHPVEIYRLTGPVAPVAALWDAADVLLASGASDDLPRLADAGLEGRPVILDADLQEALVPQESVLTDGLRARHRFFGAQRGNDVTATLTSEDAGQARDYLPWADRTPRSVVTYEGIADVTASSSLAQDLTFAGLQPAMRPYAALDSDPTTGWLTMWDPEPTITISLDEPTPLEYLDITPFTDDTLAPWGLEAATDVTVTTDAGSTHATLEGTTRIDLPTGPTTTVTVSVDATQRRSPADVVTGLADIAIPGIDPREILALPERTGPLASSITLSSGRSSRDGCAVTFEGLRCLGSDATTAESPAQTVYALAANRPGRWTMTGTLAPNLAAQSPLMSPGLEVAASSSRSAAPAALAGAVVDGDSRTAWSPAFGDRTPQLSFTFPAEATLERVELRIRGGWAARSRHAVRIELGGQEFTRSLPPNGVLTIPPTMGAVLRLEFLPLGDSDGADVAGMELTEVVLPGVTDSPPVGVLDAPCGQGPTVTVNGISVPTAAQLDRDGWLGLVPVRWRACGPVTLRGADDRVGIGGWAGLAPGDTILRHVDAPAVAAGPRSPTILSVGTHAPSLSGQVTASEVPRLLALTQNANAGWVATLGGGELAPQVVGGARQGFVVPAGASGELSVVFGPDRPYRALLVAGLLLAFLVVAAATVAAVRGLREAREAATPIPQALTPPRSDPAFEGAGSRRGHYGASALAAVAVGALIAGPAGAVAAAVGCLLTSRLFDRERLVVIAAAVVGSAGVQALVAPASLGSTWLEAGTRMVLVAALALAFLAPPAGQQPRRQARRRQLDEPVAEEAEEDAQG